VAESVVTLRVDATSATRALQGVQNKSNKLERAFGGLKTAIAGIGITVLAKQAVQTASNFEKLNVRLGLLTKASGTFAKSQQIAADAQKAFGLSATEALEGITNITARLAPLGVGVDDIKSTFFGFNTAAKLAGASTIEASNAFRQLAQALGSGRLAGDEFRSISEQIPTLLQPIAKELDVPIGKLKELAAEGKLTSDVVLRALREIETEGAASLKELVANDPTQVFKDLSNASEDLSRAVGELLVPAVIPAVKGLTELTKAAVDFVNSPIGKTSAIFIVIAGAVKTATVAFVAVEAAMLAAGGAAGILAIALNALPFVAIATGAGLLTTALIKANDEKKKFNDLVNKGGEEEVTQALRDQAKVIGELQNRFDQARGREKKALGNRLKQAETEARILEGRLQTIKSDKLIEESANKIVELKKNEKKQNEENKELTDKQKKDIEDFAKSIALVFKKEKERKEAFDKFIAKQEQSGELLQAAIDGNEKEVKLQHDINNAVAIHGEHKRQEITNILTANQALKDQKTEIDKNAEAAEALKNKFDQIGNQIKDGIVQNLTDAVMGTQTLAQSAINVLEQMRRKLIEVALQKALAGLGGPIGGFFGSLFGRANGGRVSANQPYMVGERGREVFVPTTSGTIVPNNQLVGGNTNVINVSVDASGTEVEGDDESSNQLGKLVGLAVQQELIKQQRAGGLLSRT
tara:strand:+ start:2685 stop:4772 length:2088 start_codon:yes stop_codon:yes gene_type:complete